MQKIICDIWLNDPPTPQSVTCYLNGPLALSVKPQLTCL